MRALAFLLVLGSNALKIDTAAQLPAFMSQDTPKQYCLEKKKSRAKLNKFDEECIQGSKRWRPDKPYRGAKFDCRLEHFLTAYPSTGMAASAMYALVNGYLHTSMETWESIALHFRAFTALTGMFGDWALTMQICGKLVAKQKWFKKMDIRYNTNQRYIKNQYLYGGCNYEEEGNDKCPSKLMKEIASGEHNDQNNALVKAAVKNHCQYAELEVSEGIFSMIAEISWIIHTLVGDVVAGSKEWREQITEVKVWSDFSNLGLMVKKFLDLKKDCLDDTRVWPWLPVSWEMRCRPRYGAFREKAMNSLAAVFQALAFYQEDEETAKGYGVISSLCKILAKFYIIQRGYRLFMDDQCDKNYDKFEPMELTYGPIDDEIMGPSVPIGSPEDMAARRSPEDMTTRHHIVEQAAKQARLEEARAILAKGPAGPETWQKGGNAKLNRLA